MADGKPPGVPPVPPPSSLPDFATTKPLTSFVPPRPPVLHPHVVAPHGVPAPIPPPQSNPFAPKGIPPPREKSPLPVPTPPQFAPAQLAPVPREEKRTVPAPIPIEKPATVDPPKTEVPLTPSPPTVSPPTSPAVLPADAREVKVVDSSAKEEKKQDDGRVDMTGRLMSWITKTVAESKLLSDVAEKAKHGMEQVLTTLDPGMRGFLSDDGTVELFLVASDSATIRAVKEGFERVFASVLIRSVPAATGNLPPLVNGSAYALELCRERTSRVFASKQIPTSAPLLVMQPFIMLIENKPFTATRILLEWKGNLLDSLSQLLPVDPKVLQLLETRSKADGKQAQDFSISVSQAAKEVYALDCESWAGPPPPYSFSELLEHGTASLALQFMNLTMQQTPVSTP